MAYDVTAAASYTVRTGYAMYLYGRRESVDNANNRSSYAWELYQKRNTSDGPAWETDPVGWNVSIGFNNWSGSANCDFRGVGVGGKRSIATNTTSWFTHDSNGYLNVTFAYSHYFGGDFGNSAASAVLYTDRIPKPPASPGKPVYSAITPTTATVYVPGSPNSNGSPVNEILFRMSNNPNVEVGPNVTYVANLASGEVLLTGLTPGLTYYGLAYAHNAMGYSPPGATTNFSTLSGAYVGKSDIFQGAEITVGKGGVFETATIYVGKGGVYVLAT